VVFNPGARPEQWFDLPADPGATRNLARSTAAQPVPLRAWLADTRDDFVLAAASG